MAQKYKDQDEDERRQRMNVLGSTKGIERRLEEEKAAQEKKARDEQQRRERKRRQQEAEKRRLLELEKEDQEGVEASELDFQFDKLVGRVEPEEDIIGAVPVFGPWQALQKLKYKVKMQPGAIKKGKAVKDTIRCLLSAKTDDTGRDPDFPWPRELDCIRSLREPDIVLQIAVSKVKVTLPTNGKETKGKQPAKGPVKGSKRK
jgi:hypothetical protein